MKEVKELKNKPVAVFYDEITASIELAEAHNVAKVFNDAKAELETILGGSIKDYNAFKSDVLGYSIAAIKDLYPGAFNLNMPLDKTLSMLSIDLRKLEQYDAKLKTTLHSFEVCKKGIATGSINKEDFTWVASTTEQLNRLAFAQELADILTKANELQPYIGKSDATLGLTTFVYFNGQAGKILPNHHYIINGAN